MEFLNNGIYLKVFCFPVTLKCNLRCKLCGAHSPYYEIPYHPSFQNLCLQLEKLFGFVSYIDKFDIGGGELLIRNDLHSIMAQLRKCYRSQIGKLRLITNGTITISQDKNNRYGNAFIEEAQKWGEDFYCIIDKYAVKSDKSKNISYIFGKAGIPHEIRDYTDHLHCGGWVDFGDFSYKHDDTAAEQLFKKCSVPRQGFFTSIVDGKVFPCGRARILYEKGQGHDYIDLMEEESTIDVKRKNFLKMVNGAFLNTCKFCNGMCDDSERFFPAEQML